jgi:beta-lactamase regulating signal transducer with metallopeptidase domain
VASLELLGTGILVAWLALPLLTHAARLRAGYEPAAAYRRMFVALALAVACLGLPWLRAKLPAFSPSLTPLALSVQVLATPVGGRELGAARGYAASPFDLLALVWGLACATAGLRWAVARLRLNRLLAGAQPAPQALGERLAQLAHAVNVASPRLLLSDEAVAPFSVGSWRPSVVLPTSLPDELGPEGLELILQHELLHVRRRDPLTHALARLGATVFAFHPTLPGLMRELIIAREAAVDAEIAVDDRPAYAHLLLQMASRLRFGPDPAHVAMDDTALARRIALLTQTTPKARAASAVPLLLVAAAIAGFGLLAPHVFAEPLHFRASPLDVLDPMAPHETEVDQCYELARAEDPELVIATRARFEVDPHTFRVTAADVPTPESPTFQTCLEEKALAWSFPPPPGMPPPPADVPLDAKAMVAVQVERGP